LDIRENIADVFYISVPAKNFNYSDYTLPPDSRQGNGIAGKNHSKSGSRRFPGAAAAALSCRSSQAPFFNLSRFAGRRQAVSKIDIMGEIR
jgi:hypothetical protein